MCSGRIQQLWGKRPSSVLNPDECVAIGAALQGSLITIGVRPATRGLLGTRPTVRDVTAHSLGFIVESADNNHFVNSIIIPKNSSIPITQAQTKMLRTGPHSRNELDVYLL
jgi:molecular chaperone DnaK